LAANPFGEHPRSAARDLGLSIRTDFIASPLHRLVPTSIGQLPGSESFTTQRSPLALEIPLSVYFSATNEPTDEWHKRWDGDEATPHDREPLFSLVYSMIGICEKAISCPCRLAIIDVEHRSG
jgi:hypothetical protein